MIQKNYIPFLNVRSLSKYKTETFDGLISFLKSTKRIAWANISTLIQAMHYVWTTFVYIQRLVMTFVVLTNSPMPILLSWGLGLWILSFIYHCASSILYISIYLSNSAVYRGLIYWQYIGIWNLHVSFYHQKPGVQSGILMPLKKIPQNSSYRFLVILNLEDGAGYVQSSSLCLTNSMTS